MKVVQVAVVGAGRIGLTHAEMLARRVHGARLVAVTTSRAERAAEVHRCCGHIAVYSSLEELLEAETIDAAVIASSTSAHVENVEHCAEAGVHVLCEKPLSLSLEGCDRAAHAAEVAGVKLMVGHVRRFDAGYVEAKRLLDAGAIGRPLVLRALSGDTDPPPPGFADPAVSGGLLLDSMYHDFYLARWLMAAEIVRVYSEGGALVDEAVGGVGDVDNAVVSARFASGAMATFTASRTTRYGHDLRTEIIGEEGAVHVGYFRQTPVRLLDRRGVHHDMPRTTPERMSEAFVAQLQAFVDCVLAGTPPPVSAREARDTVAAAIAATISIHRGVAVPVPPPEGPSAGKRRD